MRKTTALFFLLFLAACSGGGGGSDDPGAGAPEAGPPSVLTLPVTSVSAVGATLNASVDPNGSLSYAWFEWGTDPALTSFSSTAQKTVEAGTDPTSVSAVLSGQTPGTTYYYRAAAGNVWGTERGAIESFMPRAPPDAKTLATSSTSATGATMNGRVVPNGLDTDVWFEWGTDASLANPTRTALRSVPPGIGAVPVSEALGGLAENAMYYYRVVAQNDAGLTRGSVNPFYVTSATIAFKSVSYQIGEAHDGRAIFGLPLVFQTSESWSVDLGDIVSYPVIAEGKVFVTTRGSGTGDYGTQLHALDLATGRAAWGPVEIPGTYFRSGHAYDGGKLFVINFDGLLRCFDAGSGSELWSVSLPGQYAFTGAPTAADGVVYVGGAGSGGTLYAIDEASGALLWTAPVANGDQSCPTLSPDGVFVSYPGQVYKFAPSSGELLWHHDGAVSGGGGSTAAYANGALYTRDWAADPVGAVYRADTGEQVGEFGLYSMLPIPAFDLTAGYFLNYGTLQSVDPETMAIHWSRAGDGLMTSAPIVIDEVVIVGSESGLVYALDAATGEPIWTGDAGAGISAGDEHNVSAPLTGLGAGEGYLVVPAGRRLTAWHIAGR